MASHVVLTAVQEGRYIADPCPNRTAQHTDHGRPEPHPARSHHAAVCSLLCRKRAVSAVLVRAEQEAAVIKALAQRTHAEISSPAVSR